MNTAYCPSCRTDFEVESNPPYAVRHVSATEHYNSVTGERLTVGGVVS